jgi:SAM-dependent methyltransferase
MTRLRSRLESIDRRVFPPGEQYGRYLRRWILPDCRSVLDVGCGEDARLMSLVPGIPRSVGVDAKIPKTTRSAAGHSEYRQLDIRSLAGHFPPESFDCVVALDVIEHLDRSDGLHLLESMEAIAGKKVIVFTPNGFLPQPPAPDNPHQEHLSGWSAEDFERRGYEVVGINGWKPLRGPYAEVRWRPRGLWRRLSMLTQPLVDAHPRWAFQLLCVKVVTGTASDAETIPVTQP